jgi:trk system potassium uptake protein TrkA
MKIFIVGAGEVGIHIALSLEREGHDLVVIEKDAEKVSRLQKSMDILAVSGDGCDPSLLRTHGVDDADLFFAVSNVDAANLLAALTARGMGAKRCVVRVGNPALGRTPLMREDSEIVQLYPERLVAEEIFSLTRVPGVGKARFFADGRLVFLQARPSVRAAIYGRPLKEIPGLDKWILTGVRRASGIFIPRGDTVLRMGDLLYAVGSSETIQDFLGYIGVESHPTKKVVIAGAGQVGEWLTRLLIKEKVKVSIVQRGVDRAFKMAAKLPEALVLRGGATDPAILREAGVEEADYFVAATQEDETNLLSSLLAREAGARAVVGLYHQPEFLGLMRAVGIDIPLSPRMMIAGHILRMVHRTEILSLDLVEGGDAEVVEFDVPAKSRALKRPLNSLRFPRSAVVGAVTRGEEIFVPDGEFQLKEGDRALVFTLSEALPDLERVFRGR